MRAVYGTGYAPSVPTEIQVLMEGRGVTAADKRPVLVNGGYTSAPEWAVRNPKAGASRCADAGHAVICADLGGTQTWGNDTAQARIDDAWAYVKAQMPCSDDKLLISAQSMGALDVLNWAHQNLDKVAALALLIPKIDLANARNNPTYTTSVEAAYGGAAGYTAAEPTHNPARYPEDFADVPIKMWYSTNDAIVPAATVEAFAEGSGAELVNRGPVGHSVGALPFSAVYDFLREYA